MVRLKVHGVLADPNTDTQVVVLRKEGGFEVLPIWVGGAEGHAIRLAMEGVVPPRPTSHDLLKDIAQNIGLVVTQVVVTDISNNTYYAAIYVKMNGSEHTIDARPSDAIAFALRVPCPIYATGDVMKHRAGEKLDAWLQKLDPQNSGKKYMRFNCDENPSRST
ncbi:MAG: hypothetical protein CMH81_01650 [Nitrospiraceae bacterium]|nr:hypothetical protein [Nitrospiraceae bacterium]